MEGAIPDHLKTLGQLDISQLGTPSKCRYGNFCDRGKNSHVTYIVWNIIDPVVKVVIIIKSKLLTADIHDAYPILELHVGAKTRLDIVLTSQPHPKIRVRLRPARARTAPKIRQYIFNDDLCSTIYSTLLSVAKIIASP